MDMGDLNNKWVVIQKNNVLFSTVSNLEVICIKRFEKELKMSWTEAKAKGYKTKNVNIRIFDN